ncbi:MAG TPA: glycosyltransferase [Chthonomonadales bacterium]|nr:glycosyltransferase [Chthonomonadales bacterium]
MNILQVISSSRTSGAEKHMAVLSAGLQGRGHAVTAAVPPEGWLTDFMRGAGVPTVYLPMRGSHSLATVFRLRSLIRAQQIDIVHTHLTRATYLGYFAAAISRVPVVSSVHVLTRDFAYRWLPRSNHWFVAVSNDLRQRIVARGVPASRVRTVYNGTDIAPDGAPAAQALSVRAELGVPADALLVGQFGRVDEFKGQRLLVEAASSIVAESPRAHFVFVGHAPPATQQALYEMATERGVEDRLRFTGVRNDVARLLHAMDVVTLVSLTEACSMAIIEAMTMGRPVVATRAGGNLELIVDGETGVLVERTPARIASAVSGLLLSAERRLAMGSAARERAEALFSAPGMARDMESLYNDVMTVRRCP